MAAGRAPFRLLYIWMLDRTETHYTEGKVEVCACVLLPYGCLQARGAFAPSQASRAATLSCFSRVFCMLLPLELSFSSSGVVRKGGGEVLVHAQARHSSK